jgi:hypothetical protein
LETFPKVAKRPVLPPAKNSPVSAAGGRGLF